MSMTKARRERRKLYREIKASLDTFKASHLMVSNDRTRTFTRAGNGYYSRPKTGLSSDGVELVSIPLVRETLVRSRVSSAGIPDSFVSRNDTTDYVQRMKLARVEVVKKTGILAGEPIGNE